jgi:hypothetical protein
MFDKIIKKAINVRSTFKNFSILCKSHTIFLKPQEGKCMYSISWWSKAKLKKRRRRKKKEEPILYIYIHYPSIKKEETTYVYMIDRSLYDLSIKLFHGDRWELCNPMSLCFFEGPEGGIGLAFGKNPWNWCGEFSDLGFFTLKTWLRAPALWVVLWLTTTGSSIKRSHRTRTRFLLPISPNYKKERKQASKR